MGVGFSPWRSILPPWLPQRMRGSQWRVKMTNLPPRVNVKAAKRALSQITLVGCMQKLRPVWTTTARTPGRPTASTTRRTPDRARTFCIKTNPDLASGTLLGTIHLPSLRQARRHQSLVSRAKASRCRLATEVSFPRGLSLFNCKRCPVHERRVQEGAQRQRARHLKPLFLAPHRMPFKLPLRKQQRIPPAFHRTLQAPASIPLMIRSVEKVLLSPSCRLRDTPIVRSGVIR